jgi:multicomponent Na+:H+ antiporter subunit C
MQILLALIVGLLFGTGTYLMLRRTLVRLLIGLALLSNGANLLIFTAIGITRARPPLVPEGAEAPPPPFADPLAQALILTAIVIAFGVLAFSLSLAHRTFETVGTENLTELRNTDR